MDNILVTKIEAEILRMVRDTEDGRMDPREIYRILKPLFNLPTDREVRKAISNLLWRSELYLTLDRKIMIRRC